MVVTPPMSKYIKRSRQRAPARRDRFSSLLDSVRSAPLALRVAGGVVILASIVAVVVLVAGHQGRDNTRANAERLHLQHEVAALFAGIPQHGTILGQPTAPVTLQVFIDLEDHGDGTYWFDYMLPAILEQFVRTNVVRLEFHSFKTDTLNRGPFLQQQTGALAAGLQDRLWNYAAIFVNEQGEEFTNYATEAFVTSIAEQIPGLNLTEWKQSRTAEMEYLVEEDNYIARQRLGLHVTPSFRIGLTHGKMKKLSTGILHRYHKYIVGTRSSGERYIAGISSKWQHPVWIVDVSALKKAVEKLI